MVHKLLLFLIAYTARTISFFDLASSMIDKHFQRDPPLDGSLDSGTFSPTMRIATPVTLLRFQPVTGSRIAEHPGESEDGE